MLRLGESGLSTGLPGEQGQQELPEAADHAAAGVIAFAAIVAASAVPC